MREYIDRAEAIRRVSAIDTSHPWNDQDDIVAQAVEILKALPDMTYSVEGIKSGEWVVNDAFCGRSAGPVRMVCPFCEFRTSTYDIKKAPVYCPRCGSKLKMPTYYRQPADKYMLLFAEHAGHNWWEWDE